MAEENVFELDRDRPSREDEDPEISLGGLPDSEELIFDEMSDNLVPIFMNSGKGRDALKAISEGILRDFDKAWDSSDEYRQRKADEWRIFSGQLPSKNFPWENCANVNVPIMLENISRLTFRAEAELFGDWSNVFGVTPVSPSPEDDEIASILSAHGNWQINEDIPDFKRQQRRGLLIFFLNGDVSCHSYYDPRRRQNRHEILTTDQLVTPYTYVTTMPDYSDCPFIVKVMYRERHDLESMRGIWHGVDNVIAHAGPTWEDEPEALLRSAEAEVQGVETPTDEERGSYKLLHYEGWMSLPGQVRQRYCQVIIDHGSGQLLDVHIHEETNWKDAERLKRQRVELEVYRQQVRDHADNVAQMAVLGDNMRSNPDMDVEQMMETDFAAQQDIVGSYPIAPPWMKDPNNLGEEPDPGHMDPIHMFAHGVCIEPLTGNLGLGFGRIESDFNIAANVLTNQFIDAATLANCKGYITTDIVNFERPMSWKPGAINKASGLTGGEIKQNIMPMDVGPANPQLMDMVQLCYEWGQSAIQAPAVLSGEPGKSGETFRGIATRVEQATKQLSAATRHFAEFGTQILKNNARLNWLFMDDEELIFVNDTRVQKMVEMRVTREMYRSNYNVAFRSDLKFTPEGQKTQEADQLAGAILATEVLKGDLAIQHAVIRQTLEARGKDDLVPLLGPAPPPPQTPFGIGDQPAAGAQVGQPGGNQMPPEILAPPSQAAARPAGGPPAQPKPAPKPSGPGGPAPGGR